MSTRALSVAAIALAVIGLHAGNAQAKSVVVGLDKTCQPGITERYATIQAAVDAIPIGSTVLVCPGSYPEQVVIKQPMVLKGVPNLPAGQSSSIITVPAGGLSLNVFGSPTYGDEAAQLVVRDFTGGQAQILNMVIDGAGSGCPTGVGRTAGIKLFNVGDPLFTSAAGLVSNVIIRNQSDGCGLGEGVDAENSYITVQNSIIHDIDRDGIVVVGGDTLINNNSMHNVAQWGVWMSGGKNSVVSNNTLSTQRGIQLDGGASTMTVSGNIIGPFTGTGILLVHADGNNVKNNKINGSYTGFWMYQTSNTMVTGNVVNHMYAFGIVDESSLGGNLIQSNTITDSPKGIVQYNTAPGTDTVSLNTFIGVDVTDSTTLW